MMHFTAKTIRRLALGLAALAVAGANSASAGTSFDGVWTVAVVTNSGSCNAGYRYPIRISNGAILDGGPGLIAVSGHVRDGGAVTVAMGKGAMLANGAGHLSGSSGAGRWHASGCAGSWTA